MDRQQVYSLSVLAPDPDAIDDSRSQIQNQLRDFILEFRLDNAFIYRDQVRENVLVKQYYCDVDIAHLISYNEELAHKLTTQPADIIPLFESALKQCTNRIVYPSQSSKDLNLPEHQLLLHSSVSQISIRDLDATNISHLVRIPGIVIGASTLSSKATALYIQCRNCQHSEVLPVTGGITGVSLPRVCSRPKNPGESTDNCPLDPYFVVHEKCQFIDQQILKLQEAPDQVPVGELPRHIKISADRYLTNRVVPGSRCTLMGVFSIYQNKESKGSSNSAVAIRTPYLRAVGITSDVDHTAKGNAIFSEEEEQEFLEMSRRPDLYDVFARCIAPSIYGNQNIKKAIACLLLGGSKKILPDGMKLRGDINVLLLGDPGTAKSQLLKFVEKVAPIAIYTSGKGSSAAGLTASVQRDTNTREFYLEGGAMVLADGGVVCIDEFDKMRDEDRVAIHEAMEQQTISIAKAGITTILNARTSVLAAANPIFGRYDDLKTPGENIDFQTTILSRFDMIFIVRDEHEKGRDERIARHVMGIQMGGRGMEEQTEAEIPVEKMKRYISYCKSRCAPRLSAEAAEKLSSHFVSIRRQIHSAEISANARSSIPITVRQLEAIIRISESLAKLSLSPIATESHVDEAIRLFLASTMDAVTQGEGQGSKELMGEVAKVEEELRRRLPIGWSTSLGTLRREFVEGRGYSEQALNRALVVLQRRETVQLRAGTYRNLAEASFTPPSARLSRYPAPPPLHWDVQVPRLGPAPGPDGRPVFKSLIAYDGSPLEYSWKWNTTGSEPDIRYSWEAINDASGTAADPLNHDPTLEYMEKVLAVLPGADFTWYRHFLAKLYDPDRSVYAKELEQGDPPATTLMHAVEYNKNASFGLKSYFLPRKLFQGGDPATSQEWDDAIMKLNPGRSHPGRDALRNFLATSPEGQLMKPNVMGMDNVEPSKSRLKMYFTSRQTSFQSVRELMTMGGLRDISESSLQDLRSLILAVLGLPGDYPEDAEISVESTGGNEWPDFDALCEGFAYFFDIAPTNGKPEVKFYLTTRKYGSDDLTIARNLVAWLHAHGRGAYADAYLSMPEKLAEHRGLENGKGMHAYTSYQCTDKGEPDIKSYISPELYHRARYAAV